MGYDINEEVTTLTADQCWELLGTTNIGRLAVSVGDRPDIFPVNYASDAGKLYFRTSPGSKLLELTINRQVAFETDSLGQDTAWSVVVHGEARELKNDREIEAAARLPLRPSIGTFKPVYVEIRATAVDGRSFVLGPEPEVD
ncbi:pyridoxamine 5'-phosphate oxidase family protein [Georgenia sp. SYP-B2076]|uniref:pyridoxamine 5'-phosphate oxidase family protein n=1 Tax=Georgenia sp. SYP-B2076 TaxID=2495881 RepID=UPI000F8E6599|nr:pyridoxamine 5'-phosphate oxidase family protein [Georgenia sp. SYP-B2076]